MMNERLSPPVPFTELDAQARYIGEFAAAEDVAKYLMQVGRPYLNPGEWPFRHIDWTAAARDAHISESNPEFCVLDGHWFDATAVA